MHTDLRQQTASPCSIQFRNLSILLLVAWCLQLPGLTARATGAEPQAKTADQSPAIRHRSMSNLKVIALAICYAAGEGGGFPAATIRSPDGKPLLSWRVAMLPYLEQEALYKQFDLDEPWDSEHNKQLLDKMPDLYRDATLGAGVKSTTTSVLALVGQHAALLPDRVRPHRNFLDGTSNTAVFVETKSNVPWTKPEDLKFDPQKPLPKIRGLHQSEEGTGFLAGFADGHIGFIGPKVDKELQKKIFTIDGKEVVELP